MVVYFDGEYSGLDARGNNGIVSLALVDGNNPNRTFEAECRLEPLQTFQKDALKYIGFEPKDLFDESRVELEKALNDFTKFFYSCNDGGKSCLVSMNNPKDLEHLANGFEQLGLDEFNNPLHYRNIDLHSAAHTMYLIMGREIPSKNGLESTLNSRDLSQLVGIPNEPMPHSTAIHGAQQTAEIHKRLVEGVKYLPMFEEFDIPEYLTRFHEFKRHSQILLNK